MKDIPLTRGAVALVDDADFERINAFKWFLGSHGYAGRNRRGGRARRGQILMHREVFNAEAAHVDHINGNRLDNRRENLRASTASTNVFARHTRVIAGTGVRGVKVCRGKFQARIKVARREIHLGTYDSIEEAKQARQAAEHKYFSGFTA